MTCRHPIAALVSLMVCASSSLAQAQLVPTSQPPARRAVPRPIQIACDPGDVTCARRVVTPPPPPLVVPSGVRFTGATLYDGCLPGKQGLTAAGYCYDGDFVGPLFIGTLVNIDFEDDEDRRLRVFGLGQVGVGNVVATYEGAFRLGLVNFSSTAHSADIGVVNVATDELHGAQLGAFNYAGDMVGLQVSGIGVAQRAKGIQVAGIGASVQRFSGLQVVGVGGGDRFIGAEFGIGVVSTQFSGLRASLVGMTFERFRGLAVGGVNMVVDGPATGVLAGGVNYVDERLIGSQLGIVNITDEDVTGLQSGAFNYADGRLIGAQLGAINASDGLGGLQAGAFNFSGERISGGQLGGINIGGTLRGVQIGAVNLLHNRINGGQIGVFNYGDRNQGLQAGAINIDGGTNESLQLGLFNYAQRLKGVQLGLFNISSEGGLPFMLFMNAG